MTAKRILLTLTLALLPLTALAQDKPTDDKTPPPASEGFYHGAASVANTHTFYLANTGLQNEANEVMVAIRNVLNPGVKIYLVASQNAIVVSGPPDQIELATLIVKNLDRPRKIYRLTYTITELDADKTISTAHFSMVVVDGQHTTIKEGNKIPVATGSFSTDNNSSQTQFTYLDIGMNFDATLNSVEGGALLKTKVEQSSLGQPSTIAGVQEPVVRQTVLEGNSFLVLGKPLMLGSVDVPNTTHRFDIAVVMDAIK